MNSETNCQRSDIREKMLAQLASNHSIHISFARELHSGFLVTVEAICTNAQSSETGIKLEDSVKDLDQLYKLLNDLIAKVCE